MTKVEEALKNLGLNEKQIIVYLSLLQLGSTTAYRVAQKSGLKRPTVYVVLDELREAGLVLKIPYPKKQIYTARSPEELVAESESKLQAIKKTLPELRALMKKADKPRASYFDGIRGIKELLDFGTDMLEGGELVGFNARADGISEEVRRIFSEYNEMLRKAQIKIRGIVPDHPSLKEYRDADKQFGRDIKIVPLEKYSSDVSIDIGPDFVKILMFKNMHGVLIEDKNLAIALRQIFEMQWSNL